jgi:hypothetical protein
LPLVSTTLWIKFATIINFSGRWQIMETISDCLHLKKNLKNKISKTQKCPNKIFKTFFLIEDFFRFPPVPTTPVVHLELRYLRKFLKKFETALMVYSGALGKRIHEKTLRSKISWHCPFKVFFK